LKLIKSNAYIMVSRQELLTECKRLGIKRYSKMNKAQLESIIYLKKVADWYDILFQPEPENLENLVIL